MREKFRVTRKCPVIFKGKISTGLFSSAMDERSSHRNLGACIFCGLFVWAVEPNQLALQRF